jgi:hypothetical protein
MSISRIWVLGAFLCLNGLAFAEEGKWMPQQVLQIDPAWLRQQGLKLPVSRLWDPQRGTGLLAAAVSVPGCSAAFVSATGLVLTNHHCLFSLIQEHSRPDRDLITNGFIARTRDEELPGKTMRVTVPRKFSDVTADVAAAIPSGADDLARSQAIERKEKSMVAACEKTPGYRCSVAAFDGGLQYFLIETFELTDVRLVYAPPRAVGEFGGEVDNFRWPRHVGDFAMARVYQNGKPYQPEFFFPLSTTGVKPGDFVMVMGYPGRTFRSLTAAEMSNERMFRFELAREILGSWIHRLEETTKGRMEASIATAAYVKSMNNNHTNAEGQLEGLKRGQLIEKQRKADEAVVAWAQGKPAYEGALIAKKELDRLADERRQTATRDYLVSLIPNGPLALRHATTLVRLAEQRGKPDADRDPAFQDRQLGLLQAAMERDQKSFDQPSDEALFALWVERSLKLGPQERISAIDQMFQTGVTKDLVAALYSATKVTDVRERLRMFSETPEQLHARKDPLIELAFPLETEMREWRKITETRNGAIARLRPEWRRAVIAQAGKPVAPDANGTLRVSFAHVKGYSPRDGVLYTPHTTLAGMIEKHTGEEPFAMPRSVIDAAVAAKPSQVPLDFLADADTTGGNSGSPVVNARGELVGLNFDRVWENVANDFGYNPEVARNINVDVRFLIWLLQQVDRADGLLSELGVKR